MRGLVRNRSLSWIDMDRRPRLPMNALSADQVPTGPGVYALYLRKTRTYVGKAKSLRQRVWSNHSGRGVSMTGSAMRRNVAEYLKIASAADIHARRYQPTLVDAQRIRSWLDACEIAWLECATEADALALESDLKREHMPPLTKR